MKASLKLLLGPGLWADLHAVAAATGRLFRGLADRFGPRRRLRNVTGEKLLLHLGCGPRLKTGWINVDMFPGPGACFADLRNPLELEGGSVRHIHCEHVLEHLERDEAARFLRECRRVLVADGTLRLILPDGEKYLRAYAAEDAAFFEPLLHLGNAVQPLTQRMAMINQMFRMGGGHCYAWDFTELRAALLEAGFATVQKSVFGDVSPELMIDGTEDWRPHESLYLNAFCSPPTPAVRPS